MKVITLYFGYNFKRNEKFFEKFQIFGKQLIFGKT